MKHSKAAHDAYIQMGQEKELGKLQISTSNDTLDEELRSKLNTFGVTLWNMILKHSNIFIDAGSSPVSDANEVDLSVCRTIASGYIRSLAVRLVLIDKLLTKVNFPRLVSSNPTSSDSEHSLPLALASELEFGLAVLSRAGRALSHSFTTMDKSDDGHEHMRASYDTLVLALLCWKGLREIHHHHDPQSFDIVLADPIRSQVLDVMLLLPDVASQCTDAVLDHSMFPPRSVDTEEKPNFHIVVRYVMLLEEFVSDQLAATDKKDWESQLYSCQKFLPSLAKISYKVSRIHTNV